MVSQEKVSQVSQRSSSSCQTPDASGREMARRRAMSFTHGKATAGTDANTFPAAKAERVLVHMKAMHAELWRGTGHRRNNDG